MLKCSKCWFQYIPMVNFLRKCERRGWDPPGLRAWLHLFLTYAHVLGNPTHSYCGQACILDYDFLCTYFTLVFLLNPDSWTPAYDGLFESSLQNPIILSSL